MLFTWQDREILNQVILVLQEIKDSVALTPQLTQILTIVTELRDEIKGINEQKVNQIAETFKKKRVELQNKVKEIEEKTNGT